MEWKGRQKAPHIVPFAICLLKSNNNNNNNQRNEREEKRAPENETKDIKRHNISTASAAAKS